MEEDGDEAVRTTRKAFKSASVSPSPLIPLSLLPSLLARINDERPADDSKRIDNISKLPTKKKINLPLLVLSLPRSIVVAVLYRTLPHPSSSLAKSRTTLSTKYEIPDSLLAKPVLAVVYDE